MALRNVHGSRWLGILALCSALGTAALAQGQTRRVDLQFLVVTGGAGDYGTAMVRAGLDESLVPYTVLDLEAGGRAVLDERFLVDTSTPGVRRARFQAVVLPNERPSGLSDDELLALSRYEREFHVRQLDAYVAPSTAVGLGPAVVSGTLDGATATITPEGRAAAFSYLSEDVQFEDLVPNVHETYGYAANPLPAQGTRMFTPFVEAVFPERAGRGVILGVYADAGREELVLMVSMNQTQLAQQLLFPGILSWLSQGVYLGRERNYLAMHVDDLFQDNGRWSPELHCTLGDQCQEGYNQRIIMTPSDVEHLVAWQREHGLTLHLAYNGGAFAQESDAPRKVALGESLLRNKDRLSWINHTYTHEYMGCLEDEDLECIHDRNDQVRWTSYDLIYAEIQQNISFASEHGMRIDRRELVTGQHSGLRNPSREPSDNPNLVRALSAIGINWIGADNSMESTQRTVVGSTLTVPRYPMNIYYNCGTKAEDALEYNWFYASRAAGGSGACEASGSCQSPLDPDTGFDDVIVPREVRTTLMHVLGNDPRPHYAHQSNLAEDRILYPVLEGVLAEYRRYFANAPIVNPSMTEAGTELKNRAAWTSGRSRVTGYVQEGTLRIEVKSGSTLRVPVTVATTSPILESYAGTRSGWQEVQTSRTFSIPLASTVRYAR